MELLSLRTETDLLPDINWLFLIFPTRTFAVVLADVSFFSPFAFLGFAKNPFQHFQLQFPTKQGTVDISCIMGI